MDPPPEQTYLSSKMAQHQDSTIMDAYHKYDDVLYDFADAVLDYDLLSHPECQTSAWRTLRGSSKAKIYARLETFAVIML